MSSSAKTSLIIGGDSAIGAALAARLGAHGIKPHVTSRREGAEIRLDLAESPEHWPALPPADTAYFCAAATGLETCENDPDATSRINVTHMQALAAKLLAQGTYVVFLSTNQVFDGETPHRRADEPVSPRNEYGRQKAAFEHWLLAQNRPAAVLRLTKVIAAPLPMLAKWNTALAQGESIEAFDDLVFAPLPLASVLDALDLLGSQKPRGVFQLSGPRDVAYYEIAQHLAQKLTIPSSRVLRGSATKAGIQPQFLPRHGTLATSTLFKGISIAEPFETLGLKP